MDSLLSNLTSQAMNYAIRSGITITTTYALNQCTRLLKQTPRNNQHRQELLTLQIRLESKIRIISPAIDLIELISARGNTTLEYAVSLTKGIRYEIQQLGRQIASAVGKKDGHAQSEVVAIINSIKLLLLKIEDAIPLINLAITTSGVNLSTKLSGTISPSRLLQASTFLTAADTEFTATASLNTTPAKQQVGPTWTLSLYMLFAGHANRALDDNGVRETTWKEVVHNAKVKLFRVPLGALGDQRDDRKYALKEDGMFGAEMGRDFAYQLAIIEDLDDDRVHTLEDDDSLPSSFEDVANAGIRDVVPIHQISKIFYADTGKILSIGEDDNDTNRPVLLIKRDVHAEPPRRMLHRSEMSEPRFLDDSEMSVQADEQVEINVQILRESTPSIAPNDLHRSTVARKTWKLPANLDPEWMAFEVYTEQPGSDSEIDEPPASMRPSQHADSPGTAFANAFSNMKLKSPSPQPMIHVGSPQVQHTRIKTSLSLLEMLIKLTALQQFRQESHLAIEDELLNFFLEDSATAGAGRDKDVRRKVRNEAVKRVGFDPYDESPVKRRGEVYIASARARAEGDLLEPGFRESIEEACENCGSPSPRSLRQAEMPMTMGTPPYLKPSDRMSEGFGPGTNGLAKATSQASLPATPPSTTKSRHVALRAQSESKPSSPLSRELTEEEEV